MSLYQALGVRRVINASATLTRLGGSLMPPPVLAAMQEAAGWFIDLPELQRRVGARIAELTHNDACYVSSGAAAGITLAVAACLTGDDPRLVDAMPYLEDAPQTEVVVFRGQRNGYDYAARQTGARLVEIGPDPEELRQALGARTACVLYFAGAHYAEGALPLEEVVLLAHERGVPVIVDSAAQIPPVSNLWRFTRELGADAAIFSGGKGLCGPQSSGLVLGRREIVEGCRRNGPPNHSIGRPMKVGKEELAGLLAAVEWSLARDEAEVIAGYERSVARWLAGLAGIPGVTAERGFPSEAGQPHARAIVRLSPPCRLGRDDLVAALWERDPRVAVGATGDGAIALNPQTLAPGEDELVLAALRAVLTGKGD
ncbi:MAG TPA: aminotransferase class V-fold PLP-dependent enzyme [Thermomicrobiaceae bacterium]|nr:aminotransferase class V-fold PLP-dependent enzyme [Thermomicrobiaceae bacterium]